MLSVLSQVALSSKQVTSPVSPTSLPLDPGRVGQLGSPGHLRILLSPRKKDGGSKPETHMEPKSECQPAALKMEKVSFRLK